MLNAPDFAKGEDYVRTLQFRFYMLAFMPLAVFVYVYLPLYNGAYEAPVGPLDASFHWLVALGSLGLASVGAVQFFRRMKVARKQETLREKMECFFPAFMRMAVLMWLANVNAVVFLAMTGERPYVAVYVTALIVMGMTNPTVYTLKRKLRLGKEEFAVLSQNRPID